MDRLDRRRLVLGIAFIVCLVLLGRWAMRPHDAVNVPSQAEEPASIDSPPAKAQRAANITSASAPTTDDSASAFGTFRGRVIDAATRKPVREFKLEFQGTRAINGGGLEVKMANEVPGMQTFRTADGRFEWQYLPPGSWDVTASARGYQRFELRGLRLIKGKATSEIVLPLRPGHSLRGRIYDEASGAGIAAASVGFREAGTERFEGNWRSGVGVTSAKDGSFVLDGLPAGRVTLEISAQDYAGRELNVVAGNDISPLEIGLSAGGTIAGRLTAADGITPVAGAAGLSNLEQGFGGTVRTGDTGEFSFQHLAAGRYELTGQAESGSVAREIVLARNQRIEGIVLALSAGHSISGVLTGLRPDDLRRVSISLYRDGDAGDASPNAQLDDRGAYALHGVGPGPVHVTADVSTRRQLWKMVQMPADSDITVNFDFPSGARLSGRVTHGGKPVSGARVRPRPAVEQSMHIYGAPTSQQGEYVIEDLPVGDYYFWVDDVYKSRLVHISDDTVFDIDVPMAQLSGRVLEQGGEVPIVGADVYIWPTEPGWARNRLQGQSNDFGKFTLVGMEPGDFVLTVYKPGYEMFRERISYSSSVADMRVPLRQDMGVEVRVREAGSGKPLQQVSATELVGNRDGAMLQLGLNDDGVGYIPSALAGSTLSFFSMGHAAAVIAGWSGQPLDLQLEREETQSPAKQ